MCNRFLLTLIKEIRPREGRRERDVVKEKSEELDLRCYFVSPYVVHKLFKYAKKFISLLICILS